MLFSACGLLLSAVFLPWAGAAEWSAVSPDRSIRVTVVLSERGELRYEARKGRRLVMEPSPLGLVCQDHNFAEEMVFLSGTKAEKRRERYELFSGNVTRVDAEVTHRSLTFAARTGALVAIDLAASNEGVAFRYRFPEKAATERVVKSELTAFCLPKSASGWLQPYHAAGEYTPAYEDYYIAAKPGAAPASVRAKAIGWAFPALFHLPKEKSWVLLTESSSAGPYPACHLGTSPPEPILRIAFPSVNETTKGIPKASDSNPRSTLPWAMPWRVIIIGSTAADIAMSTLVTDLAPPSRIADTSWIRPGRAAWSWWTFPEGRNTVERYAGFTDLAASFGWEFALFDGGWWEAGLAPLSEYARRKNVASLAWSFAGDFYDPRKRDRKLEELARGGAVGVKADFWCSDRQEALTAMRELFESAAERRMLVNLHGSTLPRGWHRTWPNFITAEAVLGTESYFYESTFPEKAAELNCILPFTRNVAGPMDYTPVAVTLKKYPRRTTAAHELATALAFNSGIVCYADGPEFFTQLPAEARQILRDAPARWDETRFLVADPGRTLVMARRTGQAWHVVGLNGTKSPLPLTLDLRKISRAKSGTLVAEGADALMQVRAEKALLPSRWKHTLPPQGGFILRLDARRRCYDFSDAISMTNR